MTATGWPGGSQEGAEGWPRGGPGMLARPVQPVNQGWLFVSQGVATIWPGWGQGLGVYIHIKNGAIHLKSGYMGVMTIPKTIAYNRVCQT